jgi:hypothetical protein
VRGTGDESAVNLQLIEGQLLELLSVE